MNKTHAIAAAALLAVAGTGAAQAQDLSYNYAQATYERLDVDGIPRVFEGFGVSGSWLLNEDFFVYGGYREGETGRFAGGRVGLENITAGLGWRHGINAQTDLNLGLAFERARYRYKGAFGLSGSESDNGFSVSAGLRHLVLPQLELGADLTYNDVFDDTMLTGRALGHITPNFAVLGSYTLGSDFDGWNLGVRFNF